MLGRKGSCLSRGNSAYKNIRSKLVPADKDQGRFIPETELLNLLTDDFIREALQIKGEKIIDSRLIDFIKNKACKVFGILIYIDVENLIEDFFQCGFGDEKLPLDIKTGAEDVDVDRFRDTQWLFLSPIFKEGPFRCHIHRQAPMPFVDTECKSERESNFSVVQEWHIHRDHLSSFHYKYLANEPHCHPTVAIKELKKLGMSSDEFTAIAERETEALETLRKAASPHLIKAIAYYIQDNKHYVMFPWAQHGNLRDFWKCDPPTLDSQYIEWLIAQFHGLSGAACELHGKKEILWRHGDLKPENILCFDAQDVVASSEERSKFCQLVIADVGLARKHDTATEMRSHATKTHSGTIMYEPPEADISLSSPRSRRYDVWSLGCIYFEFLVWVLYGTQGLTYFRNDLSETSRFYIVETNSTTGRKSAQLSSPVVAWTTWIRKDPRCPENTAIRGLLELIVNRLLVVEVGTKHTPSVIHECDPSKPANPSIVRSSTSRFSLDPRNDDTAPNRADSEEMYTSLGDILGKAGSSNHPEMIWLKFGPAPKGYPSSHGTRLDPNTQQRRSDQGTKSFEVRQGIFCLPLSNYWEYAPDMELAHTIFADANLRSNSQRKGKPSTLCTRCHELRIWNSACIFSDTMTKLQSRCGNCDLCGLLHSVCNERDFGCESEIRFFKRGCYIFADNEPKKPILSLCTLPAADTLGITPRNVQISFPDLPEPCSTRHLNILEGWIQNCDQAHQCLPAKNTFLPTRVIEVGSERTPMVRLYCDTGGGTGPRKYVALSHRWGSPEQHSKFCTYRSNLNQFRTGIEYALLPKTFRDAITVTRSLGIEFLWIDSLCIVQDDPHDWEIESRLMEQVFSSAYITIAATSAKGTSDGFLRSRPERRFVTLIKDGQVPYFVSTAIDNLDVDVEQSELNQRGWVLQERALSRRTIYFAETQSYWECGCGIRCETLTKMNNRKASFLGDANFPHSVEAYKKGRKIQLYQNLYEQYSHLNLTFDGDKPIAIKGLESRLVQALQTQGGYGVLNSYLHRSLLWQRSGDSLRRITAFRSGAIPSWSWMAYAGGIRYMDIPFGDVSWADDVSSPFPVDESLLTISHGLDSANKPLSISVRTWDVKEAQSGRIIFDEPDCALERPLRCVVIGTSKDLIPQHFVIVIALVSRNQKPVFERVGVGILLPGDIARSQGNYLIELC
ncbi:HET-domain-containing protein [Aaosphaeria arxii CBS 175.79]|uniref:HET-domain-containing protein n=1 Tax=Aaosphaeria arxii CBS 175.79 TaxID=1450172 RepID=A0A6A5Y102_9PLEO|nr:HET-domain-containing protein [Aaosphaeria arxii CBS 175.79]KAF2018244.1 HET-domain-containing protein [Aaosphaeria arxii CBS 175.79]